MPSPKVVTVNEAATIGHCSPTTIWNGLKEGKLKGVRGGPGLRATQWNITSTREEIREYVLRDHPTAGFKKNGNGHAEPTAQTLPLTTASPDTNAIVALLRDCGEFTTFTPEQRALLVKIGKVL